MLAAMNLFQKILAGINAGTNDGDKASTPIDIGSKLPMVQQINQDGQSIALDPSKQSGFLLVYFYPKADTPGCTKQACSLRDAFTELSDRGLKVLGVSTDSPASQKAFQQKFDLPFDLLADQSNTILNAFGVPKSMGYSKRQAFLFKDGELVWLDKSASTANQAQDILKQLEAL